MVITKKGNHKQILRGASGNGNELVGPNASCLLCGSSGCHKPFYEAFGISRFLEYFLLSSKSKDHSRREEKAVFNSSISQLLFDSIKGPALLSYFRWEVWEYAVVRQWSLQAGELESFLLVWIMMDFGDHDASSRRRGLCAYTVGTVHFESVGEVIGS